MIEKEILDPRIKRLDLESAKNSSPLPEHDNWETWEVFHQEKRGEQHVHVGIVHAANPELALIFAKEQFGRRKKTSNIWVVKSQNVFALSNDDEDFFETVAEKDYREAWGFKVRDKINKFKKSIKT